MKQEQEENKLVQSIEQQFNISGGQQVIVQRGANPTINIYSDKQPEIQKEAEEDGVEPDKALLSVFMGDRQEMERYLKAIEGATDVQVASITKDFVKRRKISEVSKNKTLYDILKARGLYSCTYDNWRKMIM